MNPDPLEEAVSLTESMMTLESATALHLKAQRAEVERGKKAIFDNLKTPDMNRHKRRQLERAIDRAVEGYKNESR